MRQPGLRRLSAPRRASVAAMPRHCLGYEAGIGTPGEFPTTRIRHCSVIYSGVQTGPQTATTAPLRRPSGLAGPAEDRRLGGFVTVCRAARRLVDPRGRPAIL